LARLSCGKLKNSPVLALRRCAVAWGKNKYCHAKPANPQRKERLIAW
jgi:hypothetical protein